MATPLEAPWRDSASGDGEVEFLLDREASAELDGVIEFTILSKIKVDISAGFRL